MALAITPLAVVTVPPLKNFDGRTSTRLSRKTDLQHFLHALYKNHMYPQDKTCLLPLLFSFSSG